MKKKLKVHYNYFINKIIYHLLIMQNSLERDLKLNLDNFNLKFSKNIENEISESEYSNDSINQENDYIKKKGVTVSNMTLLDIIVELRQMFFIILELVSLNKNPLNYVLSTSKRKLVFSIFLIVFGFLLLLLSSLMMEKKVI